MRSARPDARVPSGVDVLPWTRRSASLPSKTANFERNDIIINKRDDTLKRNIGLVYRHGE
jgi:hypothetical protein